MTTLIHKQVEQCRAGINPRTICRVNSGWVVLGPVQFLKGYSLILPDPVVPDLNSLSLDSRRVLLEEMGLLGDALLAITGAVRINYEILGNLEPALHVHVFPRFSNEPQELRTRPAWYYDWDKAPIFSESTDAGIMGQIKKHLDIAGVTR